MITYPFADLPSKVKALGRVAFEGDGLHLSHVASGFSVSFRGDAVQIAFAPFCSPDRIAYVAAFIDGVKMRFSVDRGNEIIRIDRLCPHVPHTLTLIGITEHWDAALVLSCITLEGEGAALLPPPAESTRKMLFIGDSISCGYGVISENDGHTYRAHEQDVTEAYSYRTAEYFGADMQIAAFSGQGVVRNCHGERGILMQELFDCRVESRGQLIPYDHSAFVPQVVVINAGTNDSGGGVTQDDFAKGAKALLGRVRAVYPAAQIVWLYGMMGDVYKTALCRVMEQRGDDQCRLLPVTPIYQCVDEVGAQGHPNRRGQMRAASALRTLISQIMGW